MQNYEVLGSFSGSIWQLNKLEIMIPAEQCIIMADQLKIDYKGVHIQWKGQTKHKSEKMIGFQAN